MEMLYCIKHNRMERAQPLFDTVKITHPDGTKDEYAATIGFVHEVFTYPTFDDPSGDLDWCEFDQGWATTPPPNNFPVDDDNWWYNTELYCPEPSMEELEKMNINADILLADIEEQ